MRRAQARGLVPLEVDLAHLQISIIALTAFPLAFPQMARLASGLAPTDPRFRRKRLRFLRWLGERLSSDSRPSAAGKTAASTVKTSRLERTAIHADRTERKRRPVQMIRDLAR